MLSCRNMGVRGTLSFQGACPERMKTMKKNAVLIGVLSGTMLATPVLAATGDACLQHNRFMNWRALDEQTLVMTDIERNQYTVHMMPRCQGVTNGAAKLIFHTWTNLGCLMPGEI